MTSAGPPPVCVEVPRPEAAPAGGRLRVLHVPPEQISVVRVTSLPLGMRSYEDAVAIPVVEPPGSDLVLGAVYDREGRLAGGTQRARPGLRWRSNPERLALPAAADAIHLPGRTFFGGQVNFVFGHVLLETLARFWRDLDYGSYDQVVLYPNTESTTPRFVPELTGRALELVGVSGSRIHVVDKQPIRFEHLDVSPSPIRLVKAVDPRMLKVFDRVADGALASTQATEAPRIYLSRSRLADRRRAANEDQIEAMMAARGFVVVHPQELPLLEQIALARRAEIIAGCDGSALHVAAFSRPGTRLLAVDSRPTPNQLMVGWGRGLDAVHVGAVAGKPASRLDEWTADLDRVRDALDLRLADC